MSTKPSRRQAPARRQASPSGAATLVVVMLLFFIVALVAAYSSRNLIFEQRTSANQYRAMQAFEAAEAGLEWALTMLNSGKIDADCRPHVDPDTTDDNFRQRYVLTAPDGTLTPRLRAGGLPRQAACVFNGNAWQCSCQADAAPVLTQPEGAGPFPAFVLRFSDNNPPFPSTSGPYPPGVLRIQSTGCTRLDAASVCAAADTSGDARATVTALAAFKRAVATPPAAAVTVRRDLSRVAGASTIWQLINDDFAKGGITVHAGLPVLDSSWLAGAAPGTPMQQSFFDGDLPMSALGADDMFTSLFGVRRGTSRLQPATVLWVDCNRQDCSAANVHRLARLNPGRPLWIDGDFNLDIAEPIGTVAEPVMLVVNGALSLGNPAAAVNGLLYVAGSSWQHAGAGSLNLRGALVSEGDLAVSGDGTARIEYDAAVLGLLHRAQGSFVRVPGSWRDF